MMLSFGDAFNVAVYAQPYLWLLLLNSRVKIDKFTFYYVGALTAALVTYTGFSRGFYTTDILVCYIFMVMAAAYRARDVEPLHAVSYAFIIVFANSYFWEFPIHVASFAENPVIGNQLIQATHMLPLFLLVYVYRERLTILPAAKILDRTLLLWILVLGVTYIRFTYPAAWAFNALLNHALRWVSLFTLTGMIRLRPEAHPE